MIRLAHCASFWCQPLPTRSRCFSRILRFDHELAFQLLACSSQGAARYSHGEKHPTRWVRGADWASARRYAATSPKTLGRVADSASNLSLISFNTKKCPPFHSPGNRVIPSPWNENSSGLHHQPPNPAASAIEVGHLQQSESQRGISGFRR